MAQQPFTRVWRMDSAFGRFDLWHHHSGARVLQRSEDAAPFCFAIGLPTPARDETGLTHVLEHMVFRGSHLHGDDQLYTALRSGSLAFHLNASTGAEWTSYHCASVDAADALALEAALLDAVFHPLLRAGALREEAYDHRRGIGGVVHNEMRGHLAQPEARLDHHLRQALFANRPAGLCYGGDPAQIAALRHQDLRAYHHRHYHPASALVMMTGADRNGARLAQLDRVLRGIAPQLPDDLPKVAAHIRHGHHEGHGFWGMIFPDQFSHGEKLLLAEVVVLKARAVLGGGLSAKSGLVDGLQPYLALYWRGAQQIDPTAWLADIAPSLIEAAAKALRDRGDDEEADFRLPAALQIWPRLAAARLRGDDLRACLAPQAPAFGDISARLAGALAGLAVNRAPDAYCPPALAAVPHSEPLPEPQPQGLFAPLALSAIAPPVAPQKARLVEGVTVLPMAKTHMLRLCLWCDAAGYAADEAALLPALAASAQAALGGRASCHNGDRAGLLIEIRLRPEELTVWLDRCAQWFDAPPDAGDAGQMPLHLAAELHLRAAFSARWRQVDRLTGLARVTRGEAGPQALRAVAQKLRQRCAAGCTTLAAVPALRPWLGGQAGVTRDMPACQPKAQKRIIAADCDLFLLGLGLALPLAEQSHLLVASKAMEVDFLWPELRVKGGAYGLRSSLQDGILTLSSIRDPQGAASLGVMERGASWLADQAEDPQILQRAQRAALALHLRPRSGAEHLRDAMVGAVDPVTFDVIRDMSSDDLRRIAAQIGAALPSAARLIVASGDRLAAQGLSPDR